jgi:hypothetical protein
VIPDFAGTVFQKTAIATGGISDSSSSNQAVISMLYGWRNTAAITRFAMKPETSGKKLKVGTRLMICARP